MKKMLVSDYDDTFYINDEDIKKNVELVKKYHDKVLFVIATGRSYYDYTKKKDLYNIESKYVILNHGATIIKNDDIIYNIEIDNVIKNKLIKDLKLNKLINCFACSKKESRLSLENDNLTKIHVKYKNSNDALEVYNLISQKYKEYINCFLVSDRTAIEIVSNLANKKSGILKIIDIENINKHDVYTVGDGDTDYEMVNYFKGNIMNVSSDKLRMLNLPVINSVSELIERINN